MALFPSDYTRLGIVSTVLAKISGSHTDMSLVITEGLLTTAQKTALFGSTENGGGDVRVSSDSAGLTQLPLQVVEWDTVAETFVIHTPRTIDDVTIADIHIWGNVPSDTQPAAGSTFGSEAVWSEYLISSILNESSGSVAVDSAGNRNGTYNGALPTLGVDFGQDFNGTTDYVTYGNAALGIASAFTFSLKVKPGTIGTAQQFFQSDDTNAAVRNWQWRIDVDGKIRIIAFDSGGSIIVNSAGVLVLSAGSEYIINYVWDGSAYRSYINGAEDLSLASTTNIGDLTGLGFGASLGARVTGGGSTVAFLDAQAGNLNVIAGDFKSANRISTEYNNQNDPSTFFTYAEVGGAINVTGATPNYSYSSISGAIDLTPEITVTGATPSYSYAPISGTIELTPQITVTGITPNYIYSATSGTVETPGTISVTGATPDYNYAAITGTVTLLGTITVTGETPSFTYTALSGIVTDGIQVYTNSFVGFDKEPLTFTGYVKTNTFSGIINEQSDFTGTIKTISFDGVLK